MSQRGDKELLVEVSTEHRQADRNAEFAAFMDVHAAALHKTAYLLCGDAHRADDLTQHALERTYRAWGRAREGDPLAYARRVLINLRIDTWRRHRREVLTEHSALPERPTVPADDEGGDRDMVVRALLSLPLKQRRVVVLRHLLDLSEVQVAAELGIPVGTVKSTGSRALQALRRELGAVTKGSRT